MKINRMRPLTVVLFALGIVWSLAPWPGSPTAQGQVAKKADKTKAVKAPVAAKPSVKRLAPSAVKPVGHKLLEPQRESDREIVVAYRILRSVRTTLTKGDHDYGGHRGAAVAGVAKAENQLSEAMQFRGKKLGGDTKAGAPWHPEPQRYSDMELASKIPVLRRTISLLGRGDQDYGGHREQAIRALTGAVGELEQALKYAKATGK